MSTTNGATSIYVGEVMPKIHPDNPCAELDEANKADEAAMAESKDPAIKSIVDSSVVDVTKTDRYAKGIAKAEGKLAVARAALSTAAGKVKAAAGKAVEQAKAGVARARGRTHEIKGGKSTITNGIIRTPDGKSKYVAGCSKGSAVGYTGKNATFAKGRTERDSAGNRTKGADGASAFRQDTDGSKRFLKDDKGQNIPAGEVEDRQSFLCPEANFEYKTGNSSPHQSHTESRIIEDFMRDNGGKKSASAGGLGTLTMNVRWETVKVVYEEEKQPTKKATTSKEACGNCQRLICAAMECGLDVYMCNDAGEAVKPDCEDGKFAKKSSSGDSQPM